MCYYSSKGAVQFLQKYPEATILTFGSQVREGRRLILKCVIKFPVLNDKVSWTQYTFINYGLFYFSALFIRHRTRAQ